jgi:hypothetical protein
VISVCTIRKFYLSDLESSNAMTGAATSNRVFKKIFECRGHLLNQVYMFPLTANPGYAGKRGGVRRAIRTWHYYTLFPHAKEGSTPSA